MKKVVHYIKDSLDCFIIASKSTTINDVLESVTIDLKLSKSRHVVIACIYITPGSDLTTVLVTSIVYLTKLHFGKLYLFVVISIQTY